MATITTPTPHPPAAARERIVHPLQSLRAYIRAYVLTEGTLVSLLYLAVVFWVGLLLDYGFFKLIGLFNLSWGDWIEFLPPGFRAVVLGGLLLGLMAVIVFKVFARLTREFRDRALALVLERRFPKLLGDRLITAVELADPRLADRYGFSPAMIEQTVRDAAERVETVPITQVFNWRRLVIQAVLLAVLTIGLYAVAGIAYCTAAGRGPVDFMVRFHHIASIWFERNVLLHEVYWPRRAHLELLAPEFPDDPNNLFHNRNEPLPPVRVRAVKWVVADSSDPKYRFGWRALTWLDLKGRPELLGSLPPEGLRPAGWPADWEETWTIDRLDLQLHRPEVERAVEQHRPGADAYQALLDALEQLDRQADSPWMERKLRKLDLPQSVVLYARGATIRDDVPMEARDNNEFYGTFRNNIRETIEFTVNAADFYTPSKQISLVPPPRLARLTRDEYRPAYIYYRTPTGVSPLELRGKKHLLHNLEVSLGDERPLVQVPAGTDVVLTAETDKPLQQARIAWHFAEAAEAGQPAAKVAKNENVPVFHVLEIRDERIFEAAFGDVTRPIAVDFEFTDTQRLTGRRQVLIQPVADVAPVVTAQVEVLRRSSQGYLITASNMIPFSGDIKDDHGLSRLEYVYTVAAVQSQTGDRRGVLGAVSALQFLPADGGPEVGLPGYLAWLNRDLARPAAAENKPSPPTHAPLATFAQLLRDRPADELPLGMVLPDLERGPSLPHLQDAVRDLQTVRERIARLAQEQAGADARAVKDLDREAEPMEEALARSRRTIADAAAGFRVIRQGFDGGAEGMERIRRLTEHVHRPLTESVRDEMDASQKALAEFRRALQAGSTDGTAAARAVDHLDTVTKRLNRVVEAIVRMPRHGPVTQFPLEYDRNFDPERPPRGEGFDLREHLAQLKERNENRPQPHYQIQLWLEATDNNIEALTPGVGQSKETFTFLVVSENELLNDIAKEEEGLRLKMEDAIALIQDCKLKLGQVAGEMPTMVNKKPDDFRGLVQAAEETRDDVAKSGGRVREILVDYKHILDQMKFARVRKQITGKIEAGIVEPLGIALDRDFPAADDALGDLAAALKGANADPKTADLAQQKLDDLLAQLNKAMESMKAVTTINMLIEKLVKIEKSLRAQGDVLERMERDKYEKLIQDVTGPSGK